MASSEYGGSEETEPVLEEADIYKATSNSDFVVLRRVRLFRSKFITFHDIKENDEDNKLWIFSSQCELIPSKDTDIKEPCTKYVRPRGQWAITTLVKPKNIGTKGQRVRLYMFTLEWPKRWAAKGYKAFSFGFTDLEDARNWHSRLSGCLKDIKAEKAAAAAASSPSSAALGAANNNMNSTHPVPLLHARLSQGNGSGFSSGRINGGTIPTSATGALPSAGQAREGPLKAGGGDPNHRAPGENRGAVTESVVTQSNGFVRATSSSGSGPPASAPGTAKRALVYDTGSGGASAAAATALAPLSSTTNGSYFAVASAAAAVAAGLAPPSPPPKVPPTVAEPLPPPPAAAPFASVPPKPSQPVVSLMQQEQEQRTPSSSDSDGPYEDLDDALMGTQCGALGNGGPPCRQSRGISRGDVRHTKQRWVPYKQVNGVAIYHRPQTAGDAEAGMGGEFMVSTVVRGSPRRCLTALTSNCGNTTILGPAIVQEVLQRRQAVDGKEVLRIVLQAPGLAGAICAPREVVVETVFKTDETGPTLVLMFNSCEVPANFVEAGERQTQQPQQQQPQQQQAAMKGAEPCEPCSDGGRRSWWRRPVAARVRGGYTMAPLEEYSLDNSPEALVTCIMKVDLGGVCGERSWVRLASDLLGWTDAFLDRMLMAVTLLRDEVEQGRFVIQPLSMMATSSRIKDREREGAGSAADLAGVGLCSRSMESMSLAAAAVGSRTLRLGSSAAARAVAAKRRSRKEMERPSLVDGAAPDAVAATDAAEASGARISSVLEMASGRVAEETDKEWEAAGLAAAAAPGAEGARGCVSGVMGPGGGGSSGGAAAAALGLDLGPGALPHAYETLEEVLARMRSLSLLDLHVWDELHQPGKDAPFKIRGPTYLKERKKIPAGYSKFVLGSMDVIKQPPGMLYEHVARFIPAIRQSGAPFSVVIHLVIPGTPLLGIVATFVTDRHPNTLGTPPAQPMEDEHDWEPFDFVLHKYMTGSTYVRNHMLKLIPHIADGSWMIKQSVGTTPVILGKQLKTTYYETAQYIEVDIDISANNVASYVTGLVRGATRSLVIDMGFVLEGTTPWELPEALLGTLRLYNLDIRCAKLIDVGHEIPLRPPNMAPPPPLRGHPYTTSVPSSAVSCCGGGDASISAAASVSAVGAQQSPYASAATSTAANAANATVPSSPPPVARVSAGNGGGGAAAGLRPSSFSDRLAAMTASGGASVRPRGSGLSAAESAPTATAWQASDASPNGSTGGGSASAHHSRHPSRSFVSASIGGSTITEDMMVTPRL